MLEARNVTVRFGGLVAVNALDLDVPDRGVFALVGPNGAGKTTLINALSRVCPVTQGTVRLNGVDVLALAPHEAVRAGIARSFQRAELFPTLTVLENLLVGLHGTMKTGLSGALMTPAARAEERAGRARCERVLRELDLWDIAHSSPADLPYGHQKLLDVARALVSEPALLLLDEPFAGLTEAETPRLIACIAAAGEGRAVLMIEHHFELLESIATWMTVMDFGCKIAEGPPAAMRDDPEVIRCYLGTGRQRTAAPAPC
ncbi:MAG TPA: ABC transporter ATP-binding protein [Casimicrobiaceae bacterium]|jgi:branched-chain amino acid transport system ATP-binding protein|nr:ABC transporter ATP-binding protein [Casimicrobiaceae bacterium]